MVASGRKGAEKQRSSPKFPLMYSYHGTEYLGNLYELMKNLKICIAITFTLKDIKSSERKTKIRTLIIVVKELKTIILMIQSSVNLTQRET